MPDLRTQLAAATRMLVDVGTLGYSGHLSARDPEGAGVLIQPVDDPRHGLRPERVLLVAMDGTVIEGEGRPPSELAIHTAVYRARPDVGAVAHVHHDRTTMWSVVPGAELVPVKNHASRWAEGVPVHDDPSHISEPEQGEAMAAALGRANALLLRGHGEVIVSEDVPRLFADVVHFVENAEALAHARALGGVRPLDQEECRRFLATFDRVRHARKLWRYHASVAAGHGALPAAWADAEPAAAVAP